MPNELKGMTIDEAIEYAAKRSNYLAKEGFKHLASVWGGYHSALVDVKKGYFRLEQESKR
jgi:hypothetical protein